MTSGVYWIYQKSKDRAVYVGSSVDLSKRRSQHLSRLKNRKHNNKHLQSCIDKYGLGDFQFMTLEVCPSDQLIEREQFWMTALMPIGNKGPAAIHPLLGTHRSNETKEKLRIAQLGKTPANKGVSPTEEQRRKLIESHIGLKYPERSEEARYRIALAHKGKHLSEETKRKLSENHKGKKASEETKAKLRLAHIGKRKSDETRMRMSEAQRLKRQRAKE